MDNKLINSNQYLAHNLYCIKLYLDATYVVICRNCGTIHSPRLDRKFWQLHRYRLKKKTIFEHIKSIFISEEKLTCEICLSVDKMVAVDPYSYEHFMKIEMEIENRNRIIDNLLS